jgi:hypothetical protein
VESFFSSLKNELIHHRDYHTRDQARTEIFDYIELFYNRQRIHQSLDYETPLVYDQRVALLTVRGIRVTSVTYLSKKPSNGCYGLENKKGDA